jgi:hypothetical protein
MRRFWLSILVLLAWVLAIRLYVNHMHAEDRFVEIGDFGTWPLVLPLPIGVALVWVVPWLAGREG